MTNTPAPKSSYTRRWAWDGKAPLRGFFNAALRLILRAITRFEVIGREHIPTTEGFIVMINHIHALDPLVVIPSLGRSITPMPKVEAFESLAIRFFVVNYGCIPVHRGDVDTQAIRLATQTLKGGGAILIAPEGTRSKTGGLIAGQEGMAFIATRANALILPVAIQGTPDVFPALKRLRRARVTLTLGEPFRMETGGARPSRELLQRLTYDAMRRMAALLPESMRGVYA